MIDELLNKITSRITGLFWLVVNLDWVPELFLWYWWLFVLLIVVSFVIYLFGWARVVRIGASMLFLLGAVFVAGGHVMTRRLEKRNKSSVEDDDPPPPPPPRDEWPRWPFP